MALHVYDDTLFRAQFPAFASDTDYPESLLGMYFDVAACYIDANDHCRLSDGCLQYALNLMTAHLVALNGLDATSGGGVGAISSATIDKVSVTSQIPTASGAFRQFLIRTGFGQQLSALLSIKAVGGFMVGGSLERASIRQAAGRFPGGRLWGR